MAMVERTEAVMERTAAMMERVVAMMERAAALVERNTYCARAWFHARKHLLDHMLVYPPAHIVAM